VKLVVDTNVFISGVFFTGPPLQILRAWSRGELELVLSPDVLTEYQRVAEKLHARFASVEITPILALVATKSVLVQAGTLAEPVCADPDDDKFIATAIAAKCDMIVSGDKHLLDVSGYGGIRVLRPREFIDEFLD